MVERHGVKTPASRVDDVAGGRVPRGGAALHQRLALSGGQVDGVNARVVVGIDPARGYRKHQRLSPRQQPRKPVSALLLFRIEFGYRLVLAAVFRSSDDRTQEPVGPVNVAI